jgi:predicted membrane protein
MLMIAYFILAITIASTIAAFTGAIILRKRNKQRRMQKTSIQDSR